MSSHRELISEEELKKVTKNLQNATNLTTFAQAYSSPRIRNLLRKAVKEGLFARVLINSETKLYNKAESMNYLNKLFNSFETGQLDRWIDDRSKMPKIVNGSI
jgi:hypothetical protein